MSVIALDPGTATVAAAFFTMLGVLVPALVALYMQQRKVHKDNRSDHAETSKKVDDLIGIVTPLSVNVSSVESRLEMVQEDVKDMKYHLRDHSVRILNLEVEE